jgi:hypothetical protein
MRAEAREAPREATVPCFGRAERRRRLGPRSPHAVQEDGGGARQAQGQLPMAFSHDGAGPTTTSRCFPVSSVHAQAPDCFFSGLTSSS